MSLVTRGYSFDFERKVIKGQEPREVIFSADLLFGSNYASVAVPQGCLDYAVATAVLGKKMESAMAKVQEITTLGTRRAACLVNKEPVDAEKLLRVAFDAAAEYNWAARHFWYRIRKHLGSVSEDAVICYVGDTLSIAWPKQQAVRRGTKKYG